MIGDLSRELKDSENPDQFEVVQIATDGIAIAIHKDNPVSDLTQEQIAKILQVKLPTGAKLADKIKLLQYWAARLLPEQEMVLRLFSV